MNLRFLPSKALAMLWVWVLWWRTRGAETEVFSHSLCLEIWFHVENLWIIIGTLSISIILTGSFLLWEFMMYNKMWAQTSHESFPPHSLNFTKFIVLLSFSHMKLLFWESLPFVLHLNLRPALKNHSALQKWGGGRLSAYFHGHPPHVFVLEWW